MARNHWLRLAGTAAALVLSVTAYSWARGQNPTVEWPDKPPPPSATLLRRLAETADAFRTGSIVYIVAKDTTYYPILGVFSTPDSANTLARQSGTKAYVYPTNTPPDGGTTVMVVLPGCYKDTMTTLWVCPPRDSSGARTFAVPVDQVAQIYVTVVTRTGRKTVVPIDPRHAGATIYRVTDFDRFIVPYYTRLFGPKVADSMRTALLRFVVMSLDSARYR
jgi:hypothetical protein